MYVPLHYQVSDYDCVPTAFINAVSYLFERKEVPPMVIRTIYIYSLDTVGRQARIGTGGTSREAVRLLGHWLSSYKFKNFSVTTEFYEEEEVHLREGSPILACLEEGGVALCNILLGGSEEHYLMIIREEDGWVYCFDPYYRTAIHRLKKNVRMFPTDGNGTHAPNLAIRREWMDMAESRKRFCMGPHPKRECLLMWRVQGPAPPPPELPRIPAV